MYKLLGSKQTGSMLAEMAFAAAGVPVETRYIEWTDKGLVDEELHAKNPLNQVPTLIMPDGSIMTESAAIMLYLNDIAPNAKLVPRDQALRQRFYHTLMVINAAIYPTFTYGDIPSRWLPGHEDAGQALTTANIEHRKTLWLRVEETANAPWFLGNEFSALDIYLYAMRMWRPGKEWFKTNAPKITAIAEKVAGDPRFAETIARQS